jgi:hypothetical protein
MLWWRSSTVARNFSLADRIHRPLFRTNQRRIGAGKGRPCDFEDI